eukprot:747346-Hanusia_phi.AAC.1
MSAINCDIDRVIPTAHSGVEEEYKNFTLNFLRLFTKTLNHALLLPDCLSQRISHQISPARLPLSGPHRIHPYSSFSLPYHAPSPLSASSLHGCYYWLYVCITRPALVTFSTFNLVVISSSSRLPCSSHYTIKLPLISTSRAHFHPWEQEGDRLRVRSWRTERGPLQAQCLPAG